MAKEVRANGRDWEIWGFDDPLHEVPNMLIGPYCNWQKFLPIANVMTFKESLDIPEQLAYFRNHKKVLDILHALPFTTEFMGLLRDDGRIMCLDGHHRAMAVAFLEYNRKSVDFGATPVTIALARLEENENSLPDAVLARGFSRVPTKTNALL